MSNTTREQKYLVTLASGRFVEEIPVFARSLDEAHDKAQAEYSTFVIERVRPMRSADAHTITMSPEEVTQ